MRKLADLVIFLDDLLDFRLVNLRGGNVRGLFSCASERFIDQFGSINYTKFDVRSA